MKTYFSIYLSWVVRCPFQFLFALFAVVLFSLGMVLPDYELISFTGGSLGTAASYFATVGSDPQLLKDWSNLVQKQGENKTEWTEIDLGVTWGSDGPEKSQLVPASPIKLVQELDNGGKYVDTRIDKPLYTEPEDHLNAGRYGGQQRAGAEEKMTRDNFRVTLSSWFMSVGDEDVEEGVHYTAGVTAVGDFMEMAANHLTDQTARKKDTGMFAAFFAGADYHHYIEAAIDNSLASGATPVGNVQDGLMAPPREHGESYVWYNGDLNKITYDADVDNYEANLVTEISKVQADDNPTLNMFEILTEIVTDNAMIPCTLRHPDTNAMHDYFLVLVPTSVYNLLKQDDRFMKIVNSAFEGKQWAHPLLNPGDLVFEQFVVRSSTRLNRKSYFSAKTVFNAVTATTANTTAKMQFIRTGTAGTAAEKTSILAGTRQFVAASDAATSFGGVDNADIIRRVMVLGSGALARANGKDFGLKYLAENDYGRKEGIGRKHLYGQIRNENWSTNGTYQSTPQSVQLFVKGRG